MGDDLLGNTPLKEPQPGEMVTFGSYPQTAEGTDKTPIQWRVLQNTGGDLFLLSEYILDCKRYYNEFSDITWRDCDLRQWLNGEFYEAAFNSSEKSIIQTTLCRDNGDHSEDTEDKVFLLSVPEVKELTYKHDGEPSGVRRRAIGSDFAKIKKNDGCRLYVYDKKVGADYIAENGEAYGCSWWWSRTQLGSASRAVFIGPRSSIRSYGRVDLACYGVRPAIKIKVQG